MENSEKKYIFIEDEMKTAYLDYSMSMITARALPDVRDGLKPVHRRIIYAMKELGLYHDKAYRKSARVVGDVIGKYHPHGDSAVYDAMVRLAQDFSMRYRIVNGQGNFGSMDGDPPAAMRYTEARMDRIAEEMLHDIDKNTVDFVNNYDDTLEEPLVLPSKIPYLLLNGTMGIAVGMATLMVPHNLSEISDAICAYIDNNDIEISELFEHIKGPDFPTGGVICGRKGILDYFNTGKGKIVLRAKTRIENDKKGRERIIVEEMPYAVNKADLQAKIAFLSKEDKIEGVSFIRDESDRNGVRLIIGIKKAARGEVVLNQLYKNTNLQVSIGVNTLALVKMKPMQLSIKDLIGHFVEFRHEVVVRRTEFDLDKAEKRKHILEGLRIAVDNIDEIVQLIKASNSPQTALTELMERFDLSEVQAKAILEMRLQKLTGLEREKLDREYKEIIEKIKDLKDILERYERRMGIIKQEMIDMKEQFGDERKTEIIDSVKDFEIEDMIADENMVVTMSSTGYIKRCSPSIYKSQKRGGRGIKGMSSKDDDFVSAMFVASAHTRILFFTNTGRSYLLKVYQIPEAGRTSPGRPIVNMLDLAKDEQVMSFVTFKEFREDQFVVFATEHGMINKQPISAYRNIRKAGINAVNLSDGDRLIAVTLTSGENDILIGTNDGQSLRFHESNIRAMGRNTRGVKGIKLRNKSRVIDMIKAMPDDDIVTITDRGYGKRTPLVDYRKTGRGGIGVRNLKVSDKTGDVKGLKIYKENTDLMIITRQGIIIRLEAESISRIGRNTQGVRLINLKDTDVVVDIALLDRDECDIEESAPTEEQ